jgi:hypothetical protein
MKNKYEIICYKEIPFVEVFGEIFNYSDLYELIGKDNYMATFIFKENSKALKQYGKNVTGIIFYSKNEFNDLKDNDGSIIKNEPDKFYIDSPFYEMGQKKREELKYYEGILVSDIKSISFRSVKRKNKYHDSGEKIVPNVIYIPYEDDKRTDVDILYQNYIASKLNSGTELIQYEKEKFIGITLGINNGRIDSRILTHLGFNIESVKICSNIWYFIYKTKERRKTITDEEKIKLNDLIFIRLGKNIEKLFHEIKRSGVKMGELSKSSQPLLTVIQALENFEPSILLYGRKQIYWDIDSYIHIVLRHIKQLQIGNFKNKSSFPYKFEDLEILIEQVLRKIEDEVKRHFDERPGIDFKRVGKMSVLFNNDYYCIQIDKEGRLITMYLNN